MKYILPNPFSLSPYGQDDGQIWKKIINNNGANSGADTFFPSNLLQTHTTILPQIKWQNFPDTQSHIGSFLDSCLDMQGQAQKIIHNLSNQDPNFQLLIIGGDHSISIGTGAGLSKFCDMKKVGLLWIDAHGDFNTDSTSLSKSITGYPCAVNCGLGHSSLLQAFNDNFITKCVQIGIRDIDNDENKNLQSKISTNELLTFSNLDIEDLGINTIMKQALNHLQDCDYLWLSIDIDSLDSIYVDQKQTDVPVIGGLTPRELLYITYQAQMTNKLKVTELVQINNTASNSLVVLASRISELSLGLGSFRYGK
jgi:arginase